MSRNWRSGLSGPITCDPMYGNEDDPSRRPVPRVRPEGAYIAEANRGCLDILFKMQALTTGGGELDRPRYRKVKAKSGLESSVAVEDQPAKPAFIGVTRPAHPMPATAPKRTSTPGPPAPSVPPANYSEKRPPPPNNSMAAINSDVRLIKAELDSLKRRVHADFKQRDTGPRTSRQEVAEYRPPTAYGRSRQEVAEYRPPTAYGRSRQEVAEYRPPTAYGRSRQEVAEYRPSTAYDSPRHQNFRYEDYSDEVDSVDEQWDKAPRDWVERTRRRREVEEEVTYRRANGHTETYHRQTRNGRPAAMGNPGHSRVTFRDEANGDEARGGQKSHRQVSPPPRERSDDPDRPDGYRRVPDDERREMLSLLMKAEDEIRGRYTRLPVILDTCRSREHKRELEEALDELQSAIAVYAQKKVYIKNDKW